MNLLSHKACVPDLTIVKIVFGQPLGEGEFGDEDVLVKEEGSRNRVEVLATDERGGFDPNMVDVNYYPDC